MVGLIAMNYSHFLLNLVRVCEQFALLRRRCGQHSELVDLNHKKEKKPTHLHCLCVHDISIHHKTEALLERMSLIKLYNETVLQFYAI